MKRNSSLFAATLAGLLLLLNLPLTAQTDTTVHKKLPLAVLELTARNQEALIVVEWTTIDEEGLSHYTLQYSSDGKTYIDLLSAPSSGRAHDAAFVYTVTDYPAPKEHHYYRLLAVPLDGEAEEKAMVRIGQSGSLTTTIHPNPARATRYPTVIPSESPYQILLCDASGKVVREYHQEKKSKLLIPIGDIEEGLHLLRVYRQEKHKL